MSLDRIVTQFIQNGVSGLRGDLRAIGGDMATTEGRIERLGDRLTGLGVAGAAGVAALGWASLKAHGEIQMAEIGFSKSLGSMEAAKSKIQELRDFDRTSPFSFSESVKGAQRLAAVGFKADELMGVLTDIGDVTSGSGGGTDDFMGIARAIGQMRSKGRISMEEINQLSDRAVPALDILQKQLKLTDKQRAKLMEGTYTIKSDVGVDALLKGFRELYGGAMMEASKTFPGQVSNLQSAVFQLGDAIGEVLAKDGTGLLKDVTSLTDKTTEFVRNNPELVKTGLILAGIGSVVAVITGQFLKWQNIIATTAAAKKALEKATKADDVAEKAKAVTAGKEALALEKVGIVAKKNAGLLGLLAKVKPYALPAAAAVAAGYGASDDYKSLGYSNARANTAGAATGAAVGFAMMIPVVREFTLAAIAARYALNQFVSVPMEKAAQGNITDEEAASTGKMTRQEKSDFYFKKRDEALAKGDATEAHSFLMMANKQRRFGQQEEKAAADAAAEAKRKAEEEERRKKAEKAARDEALWGDTSPEVGQVTYGRSGAKRVVFVANMPASAADDSQRRNDYRNRTAAPNYTY